MHYNYEIDSNLFGSPKDQTVRFDHNLLEYECKITDHFKYRYHLYCYQFISLLYHRAFTVANFQCRRM